ncbi:hypothetical protein HD806DRAFT_512793 [Xylariaceae sp. AK1471]|nr:hypothetical protein HD806DRAFT_512793 [Xylariaceae sp. AK1471]
MFETTYTTLASHISKGYRMGRGLWGWPVVVIANGRLNPLPWVEDQRRPLIYSISRPGKFLVSYNEDPRVWIRIGTSRILPRFSKHDFSPRILFVCVITGSIQSSIIGLGDKLIYLPCTLQVSEIHTGLKDDMYIIADSELMYKYGYVVIGGGGFWYKWCERRGLRGLGSSTYLYVHIDECEYLLNLIGRDWKGCNTWFTRALLEILLVLFSPGHTE